MDNGSRNNLESSEEAGFVAKKKNLVPDNTTITVDAQAEARNQANQEARMQLREVYDDSKAGLSEIMNHEVMHTETRADIAADNIAKKHKRNHRIFRFSLVVFLGIFVVLGVFKYVRGHRTVDGIPKPVQVNIQNINPGQIDHRFEVEDGYVEMTYLATYDIKGLVVFVDDYDNLWANLFRTEYDNMKVAERAMPRDLGIVWGDVAAHANEFKWDHGYRDLVYSSKTGRGFTDSDGDKEISNNHIIIEPDSELRKKLMKVKERDFIEIKGYLVSGAFVDEKRGYRDEFASSMSRSDTSRMILNRITTCEIIYLTDIEWLD